MIAWFLLGDATPFISLVLIGLVAAFFFSRGTGHIRRARWLNWTLSGHFVFLARARGRVPRCNATAVPATSKTAIAAGARRPKSPAHRTGDR